MFDDLLLVNELRRRAAPSAKLAKLEDEFEGLFNASARLAVYGSLAPGRENHHVIAGIRGQWQDGLYVRGYLVEQGWGASLGYPALRLALNGPLVEAQLFISSELPQHWARLDEFEGDEYLRVLTPVFCGKELITVANLYAFK